MLCGLRDVVVLSHRTPLVHERVVFYPPFIVHCSFLHSPMHCAGALLDMASLPRRSSPLPSCLLWAITIITIASSSSFPSRHRRRHRDHHDHSFLPSPRFRDVACVLGSMFICSFVSRRYVSVLRVVSDVVLVEHVGVVPCELSHFAG